MSKPLSMDLREWLISAVEGGMSRRAADSCMLERLPLVVFLRKAVELVRIMPESDLGQCSRLEGLAQPAFGMELAFNIDLIIAAKPGFGKSGQILMDDQHAMPFLAELIVVALDIAPLTRGHDR